jgi:hypothetical protein
MPDYFNGIYRKCKPDPDCAASLLRHSAAAGNSPHAIASHLPVDIGATTFEYHAPHTVCRTYFQ